MSAPPSLFSTADGASPVAAIPTLEEAVEQDETSEYVAPLSGLIAADPSIDGTSVGGSSSGGGSGLRKEKKEDVTDEDKAEALAIKSKANAHFTLSKYRDALDLYTVSLNRNPFDPAVWSNRAACRLKLEEHGLAIADATRSVELDPRFVKAYFRRAVANLAIMKPKAALVDFKKVVALEPNNAAAKAQLDATQKLLRRLQFEAAIGGRDEVPTSKKLLDQIASGGADLEASYAGPRPQYDATAKRYEPTREFCEGLQEWFKEGKTLPKRLAWEICLGAYERFKEEETLVDVLIEEGTTVDVIGDTHGQYFDLMHLLSLTGLPGPNHKLLFNGDFVDRGSWSTEVVLLLFAWKWFDPTKILLNRGNHETADMNKVYGFEGETKKKYSEMTYKLFEEIFTALPLAHLLTCTAAPSSPSPLSIPRNPTLFNGIKRFYVVHGGLFSKEDVTLADIKALDRRAVRQPGQTGLMCDMLWTDPQDALGRGPSKRGVACGFGPDITKKWLEANGVTAVLRSHEVRQEGYSVEHDGRCITIFSAPNYVDQVGNLGAFARINERGDLDFTTFKESAHPAIKPMAYAMGMGGML